MWDFFQTVRHRHSVRRYQPDMPVEPEKLHAILEAISAAPSAGDLQAYHIYVLTSAAARARLHETAPDQSFISEAPLALVFCADRERSRERFGERGTGLFATQDATIAAAFAQLAAVAAGLASAWVGRFDRDQVSTQLDLPKSLDPVAIISVGYPAELPAPTPRRRLSEVVTKL
jgi:nitroreductase